MHNDSILKKILNNVTTRESDLLFYQINLYCTLVGITYSALETTLADIEY